MSTTDVVEILNMRVPACSGKAFTVAAGQVLRIIMGEGKQVGDLTVVSLENHREGFSCNATTQLGGRSFSKASGLFSGPPYFRKLMSIENDRLGTHFLHGRCSTEMYRRFFNMENVQGCHENIVGAFREMGVAEEDVPFSTFNLFMKAVVTPGGSYHFYPPIAEKGEFVDFRAEVDVILALSACPHPFEVNANEPKPLDVQIFESRRN
jgi:uncharacterized protein YcgI (DUF1989 family)